MSRRDVYITPTSCRALSRVSSKLVTSSPRRSVSFPLQPEKHLLKATQIRGASPSPRNSLTLTILQLHQCRDSLPCRALREASRHLREVLSLGVFVLSDGAFFFTGVVFVEGVYGAFGCGYGFEAFGFGTFVAGRYFGGLLCTPISVCGSETYNFKDKGFGEYSLDNLWLLLFQWLIEDRCSGE